MLTRIRIFIAFLGFTFLVLGSNAVQNKTCIECICERETGCKPMECKVNANGNTTCGWFQLDLNYYIECGQPDIRPGEKIENGWKRCADDYRCASQCVQNYVNKYKAKCEGFTECERMVRIHNGGPRGCMKRNTLPYWNYIYDFCFLRP
ncbi:destabilase domain-containing protein [Ditylenchus destructor]|nr:destabilase domain-containing protein [Ditylenchus destructor]